jgi:hypothetical protein
VGGVGIEFAHERLGLLLERGRVLLEDGADDVRAEGGLGFGRLEEFEDGLAEGVVRAPSRLEITSGRCPSR